MRSSINSIFPLAVFFALVILLALGLGLDPSKVPSPLIDKPAPKFRLPQLADGNRTIGTDDFAGHVTLFNVWASWCVSCRYEHPILMQLTRQYNVPIYSLNYKDDREAALTWLKTYGDPYVATAFDATGRVGIDWGVYGTPETFIIDKQGRVRYKHTGPISVQDAQDIILPWVKQLQQE